MLNKNPKVIIQDSDLFSEGFTPSGSKHFIKTVEDYSDHFA